MKSWKTTLAGILGGAGAFLRPSLPEDLMWISDAMIGLGIVFGGWAARDKNVSTEQERKIEK